MTDREMLELAAKAAGKKIIGWNDQYGVDVAVLDDHSFWQPLLENHLTDCMGDALRLAVKYRIDIEWRGDGRVSCFQHLNDEGHCYPNSCESAREDIEANTRRAIVRAAAEIGRAMG